MNSLRSPTSRFRHIIGRLDNDCRKYSTPNVASSQRDPSVRIWPRDARGEEIKTAKARRLGINTSVQKLNMVAKLVRSLTISESHRQLAGCKRKTAPIVRATIDAAVVNARAFGLDEHRLIVCEAFVGKGVYLRRLRPWHGKGRFGVEHKKYSHLTVTVRELDEELWEAKVLPQYVHMRRSYTVTPDDRDHPVLTSEKVRWTSDLDESLAKTRKSVLGLRATLNADKREAPTKTS